MNDCHTCLEAAVANCEGAAISAAIRHVTCAAYFTAAFGVACKRQQGAGMLTRADHSCLRSLGRPRWAREGRGSFGYGCGGVGLGHSRHTAFRGLILGPAAGPVRSADDAPSMGTDHRAVLTALVVRQSTAEAAVLPPLACMGGARSGLDGGALSEVCHGCEVQAQQRGRQARLLWQ